jgi:EAL domain-containing protein (putative c-di-GMP-specific phosphodiesterase class I)
MDFALTRRLLLTATQPIRDLVDDRVDQATVRCIRNVAKITGKKTIAGFVETEAFEDETTLKKLTLSAEARGLLPS